MRRWGPIAVGLVAVTTVLFLVTPAEAAEPWRVRLQAAWSTPQGDFREVDGDEVITADFAGSFGFGLQIERMVSSRVGVELGVLWNESDVNVVIEEPPVRLRIEAPLRFTPVTLGVNYHLGSGGKTDFYFGPAVAYIFYDDIVLSDPDFGRERLTIDDDYAWGFTLGIDVNLTDSGHWAFNSELRWMKGSTDFTNPDNEKRVVDVDPLYLTIGVTYRF
ncbi:MAG: OmpW family outer membrane protein [Thermoanaerobaculia bacterium]